MTLQSLPDNQIDSVEALPFFTDKQKQMLQYGLKHPYSILAADMRLGKTAVAIYLQRERKANCLVVCPAYLISNWRKEINKWNPEASVTTFKRGKDIYDVCDSDFVVTSYDLVQKAEHLFEWADMVVADEIHHLKNMMAKRSQFFHRVIYENSIKSLHGLTGTPIKNRVKEFYSLLALMNYEPNQVDHKFLDTYPDEITFADQFSYSHSYDITVRGFTVPITKYFGLKNEGELKRWLEGKYIRLRASPGELPPISYLDTLVSDINDDALLDAFEDFFAGKNTRTDSVLPEHKKNAAIQKVPFTIKYIEDLMESVPCCLVYSDHREPIHKIAAYFKVPAITGEMSPQKRSELVSDFQAGKLNVLCATIGSLKEGADLFRAKDLVLSDPSWVPGDILQVINRMRALGEKDPRTIHRIMGSPQDTTIWKVLESKIQTINRAT